MSETITSTTQSVDDRAITERTHYKCPCCHRESSERWRIEECVAKHEKERIDPAPYVGREVRYAYTYTYHDHGHSGEAAGIRTGTVTMADTSNYWRPKLLVERKGGEREWTTPGRIEAAKAMDEREKRQRKKEAEHREQMIAEGKRNEDGSVVGAVWADSTGE